MFSIACCKGRYTAVTISSNSTKRLIKQSRPTLALFSILCMISLQPSHPLTMMASSTHSSKLQTTGGDDQPPLLPIAPTSKRLFLVRHGCVKITISFFVLYLLPLLGIALKASLSPFRFSSSVHSSEK